MANTLVNSEQVTFEVAISFVDNLRGVANFDRSYSDEFAQSGGKIGDTVKIRLPQQWEAVEGEALEVQNILDRTVNLIINRRRHVGFGWSTAQETTDLDDIKKRYVQPAAETLASVYDRLAMQDVVKQVYNMVGTLGTVPNTGLTYSTAVSKILDHSGPDTGLVAVLSPLSNATIAASTALMFHPGGKLAENWTRGQIAAEQLGIGKWFTDQNTPRFTTGVVAAASSPRINGALQTGSTIATDGWGANTALVTGDIVTFAGVYGVNEQSKEPTGRLKQFTLTADAATVGGGALNLSVSPSIITTGALQNVSGTAADDAIITYWSMADGGTQASATREQNLVFAPKAFATCMVDLVMPNKGAGSTRVNSKQLGVSLRYVEQYNITTDKNLNRLDFLAGNACVWPQWAVRVTA